MQITNDNYFSTEAQMEYMGASQFKAFRNCEAAAIAELRGEYIHPTTTALLVGSYVDSYYEGTIDTFKEKHPELFKKDGTLKADYLSANTIIERLESDKLYTLLMSGKKQVIRTGEIAGVPFKIKIDSLLSAEQLTEITNAFPETNEVFGFFSEGAIVDQKIMKDTKNIWSAEERFSLPFVEAWGYDIQGAIYQAIEGNMLPFILAVGTKESEPDLVALHISDNDLAAKLVEVEELAPRYQAIKQGKIKPKKCEHCDYCRSKKKLHKIIDYREFYS